MKSLIMFTNSPLDYEKCLEVLEPIFPGILVNKLQCFYGNPPKSFNFDFEYERDKDSLDPLDDELANRIPIENPYCTVMDYHKDHMAQKVVNAIKVFSPEMYILDDQTDWLGPADEFVKIDYGKINQK